jgi:hypothetical protein
MVAAAKEELMPDCQRIRTMIFFSGIAATFYSRQTTTSPRAHERDCMGWEKRGDVASREGTKIS